MSSFNCHFRVVIDQKEEKSTRIRALRSCISYLVVFEEPRSYTKLIQRYEDTYQISLRPCNSAALSDDLIREILMDVVRERNTKLEILRRQERQNLRRKLERRLRGHAIFSGERQP